MGRLGGSIVPQFTVSATLFVWFCALSGRYFTCSSAFQRQSEIVLHPFKEGCNDQAVCGALDKFGQKRRIFHSVTAMNRSKAHRRTPVVYSSQHEPIEFPEVLGTEGGSLGGRQSKHFWLNISPEHPKYPYLALAILALLYVHNQWSRSLIYYLVNFDVKPSVESAKEFINIGLNFDSNSYALLASVGFTALYAVASLAAGRLADVASRRALAAGAALAWSAAALAQGSATTFRQVFCLRLGTGLAQAFSSPAAYTFLAEAVPPGRRALANACYASGMYLGAALASLSMLLARCFGWRSTSRIVGGVGLILGILAVAILRDPRGWAKRPEAPPRTTAEEQEEGAPRGQRRGEGKGGEEGGRPLPLGLALGAVLGSRPARAALVAAALREAAGLGVYAWASPFFRSRFPDHVGAFAVVNAAALGAGGLLASFAWARVADAPPRGGGQRPTSSSCGPRSLMEDKSAEKSALERCSEARRAWTCAMGCLVAVPFWVLAVSTQSFPLAVTSLGLQYAAAEGWYGPTTALLQGSVPARARGLAQGLLGMILTLGNFCPLLIGSIIQRTDTSLQAVLLRLIPLFYLSSAAVYLYASKIIEREESKQQIGKLKHSKASPC